MSLGEQKIFQPIIPEKELRELKKRIERMGKKIEDETIAEKRKEVVKETIRDYFRELGKLPPSSSPVQTRDEAKEIEKFSKPEQVGALVSLVFEKGLKYAIEVAQRLNNPAILDEFHDVLVERYYQVLVESNVIQPI